MMVTVATIVRCDRIDPLWKVTGRLLAGRGLSLAWAPGRHIHLCGLAGRDQGPARTSRGRDGSLHGRRCARFRRRAQAAGRV